MKPSDKAIEAMADELQHHGVHHGWFPKGLPSDWRKLDPIGRREFLDIVGRLADAAYAAQFQSEDDSAAMIIFARYRELEVEAASWKGRQEATALLLKQVEIERDEWKKQAEICRDRMQETEINLGKHVQENDALKAELVDYKDAAASEADFANEQTEKYRTLQAERDALLDRLAPEAMLEGARAAIEAMRPIIEAADKEDSFTLESNARLAPAPTAQTPIANHFGAVNSNYSIKNAVFDKNGRMLSGEICPYPASVDDEALVEIMARTNYGKKWDDPENGPVEEVKEVWRNLYRKPLAAIRPHIEAAERERLREDIKSRFSPKTAQQIRDETDRLIKKHRQSVSDWLEAGSWKQSGARNE